MQRIINDFIALYSNVSLVFLSLYFEHIWNPYNKNFCKILRNPYFENIAGASSILTRKLSF